MVFITGRLVPTLLTHGRETGHQQFPYGRYGWQTYRHLFRTAAYTKHDVPQNGISDTILTIFELTVTEAVRAEWQVRLPQ